jgi:hypothetical protein
MITVVSVMPVMPRAAPLGRDVGFELVFVDVRGVQQRRSLRDCWDVRLEDGRPVREFRWAKGQRHNPGRWWSATTGLLVGYESWLERDVLMGLDCDPKVVGIVSQPQRLMLEPAPVGTLGCCRRARISES